MIQFVLYGIVLLGVLQTSPLPVNECDQFLGYSPYNTYKAYLSLGRENVKNDNYGKAIEHLDCAINYNPAEGEAHYLRGVAYYHKTLYDQSLEDFTNAIKFRYYSLDVAFLYRGISYYQLSKKIGFEHQNAENFDKALKDFDFAIQLEPKNHYSYQWRATAYTDLRQFDKAIADWTRAIELEPKDSYNYHQRGWVHSVNKHYQAALNDFETANDLGMNTADVYYGIGQVHSRLGYYMRSIRYYDLAIKRDYDFIRAYAERGHSYFLLGDYLQAIENYDRTVELGTNSDVVPAGIYVSRGRAYAALEEFDQAETNYFQAMEVDPNYPESYLMLGQLYDVEQSYDEAVDQYLIYLELAGENAMPWVRERINQIRGFHPL